MTMSEAIITGLQTTVLGMVTIFVALVILMLAIAVMKNVFYKTEEKPEVKKAEPEEAVQSPVIETEAQDDEEELIAVFAAAIAASLNTSTYNLRIKSYRRIEGKAPAWNKAAVRENNISF